MARDRRERPHWRVAGKAVVVTGGASGLGASIARVASTRGASRVAILDIEADRATQTADELRKIGPEVSSHWCDVSSHASVLSAAAEVIQQHGPPDLLCANAGVAPRVASVLETDLEEARWVFDVNVFGVLSTIQAFAGAMIDRGSSSRILVTGSEHSLAVPHVGLGSYTASKHALLGLCDVLRRELPEQIGLSLLCPGLIATELWDASRNAPGHLERPIPDVVVRAGMALGASASEIAAQALDGVEVGRFLTLSHESSLIHVRRRLYDVSPEVDGRLDD